MRLKCTSHGSAPLSLSVIQNMVLIADVRYNGLHLGGGLLSHPAVMAVIGSGSLSFP